MAADGQNHFAEPLQVLSMPSNACVDDSCAMMEERIAEMLPSKVRFAQGTCCENYNQSTPRGVEVPDLGGRPIFVLASGASLNLRRTCIRLTIGSVG